MAETALVEPQAEAPASRSEPTRQRAEHSQSPADVLRQSEARGRNNPVERSFGERKGNLRERLKKLGVTLAILAGIGGLIIGTHGLGIVPLKGWLTAHHLTSLNSITPNNFSRVDTAFKTVTHNIDKGFKGIKPKI